jgi:hypothetical protein
MKTKSSFVLAATGLGFALAFAAAPATASCLSKPFLSKLMAGGIQPVAAPRPMAGDWADSEEAAFRPAVMPGLWKFQFTNPDGSSGDFGYNTFDAGGSEVLVSFGRPPMDGDVCVGVWKQVGLHHVKVNHYAPIFDADLVTFIGTLNIREDLAISLDGHSYQGPFAFTGYDTMGNIMFQGTGTTSATRITLKSAGY